MGQNAKVQESTKRENPRHSNKNVIASQSENAKS
jgi:hypothetical protein